MTEEAVQPNPWDQMLADSNKSGPRLVNFLGNGQNKLRFVIPPELVNDPEWQTKVFVESQDFYTKVSPPTVNRCFIAFALVRSLGKTKDGVTKDLPENHETTVVAVKLPITAYQSVLGQLSAGFDLFSDGEGHPITLTKAYRNTSAASSPNAVPIVRDSLTWPEMTLQELADEYRKQQAERANKAPAVGSPKTETGLDNTQGSGW